MTCLNVVAKHGVFMLIPVCMATMYLALLFIQNILPFLIDSNPPANSQGVIS